LDLTKARGRLAAVDDSRRIFGRFAVSAAIDPFFLGGVYHQFMGSDRKGSSNKISARPKLRASITSHLGRAARRFAAADEGNIAMIFAIALVPVLSLVGAAIDYSRG
jgi:hypothetical protein